MKRRNFLKSCVAIPVLSALPLSDLLASPSHFTTDELIGKGKPNLVGDGFTLRKKAATAFVKMQNAATQQGLKIKVASSYRSYAHQNRIWERKYRQYTKAGLSPQATIQKIIQYSTIPGTSRHHWGTDLDIIEDIPSPPQNVLNPKNFATDGPYHKLHGWLQQHAEKFGFFMVYTNKKERKGFSYEPWHFSFAETSIPMLTAYKKLDLQKILQKNKLMGSSYFSTEFIQQYKKENILEINPVLLPDS